MKDSDSPDVTNAIAFVRERLKAARDRRFAASAEAQPAGSRTGADAPPAVRQPLAPVVSETADTQWGDTVFDSTPSRDERGSRSISLPRLRRPGHGAALGWRRVPCVRLGFDAHASQPQRDRGVLRHLQG